MTEKTEDPDKLSKAAFLALRDEWIDYVNQNTALSHATVRIGTFIVLRMNAKDQRSFWPVKKIARMLDCSTKTVSEAIAALVSERVLIVTRANRRANQSYQIRMPYSSRRSDYVSE